MHFPHDTSGFGDVAILVTEKGFLGCGGNVNNLPSFQCTINYRNSNITIVIDEKLLLIMAKVYVLGQLHSSVIRKWFGYKVQYNVAMAFMIHFASIKCNNIYV